MELQIAVSTALQTALQAARQPVPSPIRVLAMIDTGASSSVVSQGILPPLKMHPVGVTRIHTPSSTNIACPEFAVRLLFPNNVIIETTMIEAPLQGQHIQALIGRDVLAAGVLVYIGYGSLFSLSF